MTFYHSPQHTNTVACPHSFLGVHTAFESYLNRTVHFMLIPRKMGFFQNKHCTTSCKVQNTQQNPEQLCRSSLTRLMPSLKAGQSPAKERGEFLQVLCKKKGDTHTQKKTVRGGGSLNLTSLIWNWQGQWEAHRNPNSQKQSWERRTEKETKNSPWVPENAGSWSFP